jgi:nucleotide-binding universal stress UspA family protein
MEDRARGRVEFGDPAARLADVASEERASLVVVGWRGRRFPRSSRLLTRLMRRCECPVVVVRRAAEADDDTTDRERIAPLADC